MASKLARQIAMYLVAHDIIMPFRSNRAPDLIDTIIKGKTISAKEVARLQENERILSSAIEANNDLLRTNSELKRELNITDKEASILAKWLVDEKKLSQSLQEKLTISVQNYDQLRKENERLQKTGTTLASYILVQYADQLAVACSEKSEQISPPPCLKPLDAMKWNEQVVYGNITSGS